MTFNPDDFVFEKVRLPEDDPTILEYDALQKLVILKASYPSGEYDYQYCQLSPQVNTNLLEGLPDKFSNRNDRIVMFYIRSNGSYKLQKEKLKYNFKTKESTWVRYDYTRLTLDEAKELFDAIKTAVWLTDAVEEEKRLQDTIELAKKPAYLDRMHVEKVTYQTNLLRSSDWRILEDAPETFEDEKELWKQWRSKLRDIVKSPEEFDSEMDYLIYCEEFKWPKNPEQYHAIDPEHNVEYLSDNSHWSTEKKVDLTYEKMQRINATVNDYISQIKNRKESGLPISREMYNRIKKYSLDLNLDDVQIVEAE